MMKIATRARTDCSTQNESTDRKSRKKYKARLKYEFMNIMIKRYVQSKQKMVT